MGDDGGTYTLVVELPRPTTVEVGALGTFDVPAGAYAYVGSALGTGGFARVDRHRRVAAGTHDVRHWHVDYLTGHPETTLVAAVTTAGVDAECAVADALPQGPIPGFGASDCTCRSHLGYAESTTDLRATVEAVHDRIEAERRSVG
ncbi:MAG: DUF123 domain-containing protein [Haloferacaceae archaeon]